MANGGEIKENSDGDAIEVLLPFALQSHVFVNKRAYLEIDHNIVSHINREQ